MITVADINAYAEAYERAEARLVHQGRVVARGTLHASRPGWSKYPTICDYSRKRTRYVPIFDRHIERGEFQIKVGNRYRPATEVIT